MILSLSRREAGEKLSKNFRAGEFACKCGRCERILIDEVLVEYLQQIRDHFGKEVVITSGYRCQVHNARVGGASASKHMEGMAADIQVQDVASGAVARFAQQLGVKQIGLYDGFVHVGSGVNKSFWKGQNEEPVASFVEMDCEFSVTLPLLMRNSRGEAVRALQQQLIGMGYDCGEAGADGEFGPATEKAVKKYQSSSGLPADGVAGIATRKAMLGVL